MSSKNKPVSPEKKFTLGEASAEFLISLTPEGRDKAQPEITKFVRWYGERRPISGLTAQEVENYSNKLTATISELPEKIDPIKEFLSFAYKKGFNENKLSAHLKARKSGYKLNSSSSKRNEKPTITLTPEGHAALEAELKNLRDQQPAVREEMRKAAADKDFKENAPLAAAREQMGKIEGRIQELDATLKAATIMTSNSSGRHGAFLGDKVVLKDLTSGEILRYTLVDVKEANPNLFKISVNSPIGKAIVGHKIGDKIEVNAPAGILPFQIQEINRN
jgi:transcription elongation factor GreA